MTAAGTQNIVATAEAKEDIPAAFSSLLSMAQIAMVKKSRW